jgi:hypothetical protein
VPLLTGRPPIRSQGHEDIEEATVGQRRLRQEALSTLIEVMSFELWDNPSFVSELFIEKHNGGGVTATQSRPVSAFDQAMGTSRWRDLDT